MNSDATAAPIAAALDDVKADLMEFHRDRRMYEWTGAKSEPFGSA